MQNFEEKKIDDNEIKNKQEGEEYINTLSDTEDNQLINYEQRLINYQEIYNEAMSPTIVYIAQYTQKQRNVVVKKIIKSKLNEEMAFQAKSELEISIQLKHYNVVQTYETHENDQEFIIIQEFLEEADYFTQKTITLRKPIKKQDKLQVYLFDILSGLEYIHSLNIIHLDIKPQNLYCCDGKIKGARRVKIGDFGLARLLDKNGEAKIKEVCGTYGYKAPEVKDNSIVTKKADIWSLGITIYYMICAYLPHHVKGYKYGEGDVPFRPFDWKKKPQLKQLVEKMLIFDICQRPTVEECLEDAYFQNNLPLLRKRSKQFSLIHSNKN